MWVRLTLAGYRAICQATATDTPMYEAFTREVIRTRQRVDVNAPYVAWRNIQQTLHARTFGPLGGKRVKANRDFVALRTITKEINFIDTHPALQNAGMLEWQAIQIPAWRIDPDPRGRAFSPYPRPGHEFVILTPRWTKIAGTKSTFWTAETSGVGELCDEATHLRLWRPVAV